MPLYTAPAIASTSTLSSPTQTLVGVNDVDSAIAFLHQRIVELTGQIIGKSNTYAGLPLVDEDGNAVSEGDLAALEQDDLGTSIDPENPDYPKGLYRYSEATSSYSFYLPLAADAASLTLAEALLGTSTAGKSISAKVLEEYVTERKKFFQDPVIGIVDTLPTIGLTDGDRYLLRGSPPTIQLREAGAWVSVAFEEGAIATTDDVIHRRLGDRILTYSPDRKIITQTAHGLTLPSFGALPVYRDNGVIRVSQITSTGEMTKSLWVTEVIDADTLEILEYQGFVTVPGHGLTERFYWLSETAGEITGAITPEVEQLLFEVVNANTLKLLDEQPQRNGIVVEPTSLDFTAEASNTPTTNQVTIPSGLTGIRVYSGDISRTSDRVQVFYSIDGAATQSIEIFKYRSSVILAPAGSRISVGTATGGAMEATAVKIPDAFPVTTGVTGVANCDRACPPLWNPTASHITLPSPFSAFTITADGTRRQIFIREFDGTKYLPERFYWLLPAENLTIFCDYTQVAIANQDGATLNITAPTGATIGGVSTVMSFTLPTPNNTFAVTNVAELKAAIAAAASGDEIVLADGTYAVDESITQASFTANVAAGNVGSEGIVIRSTSSDPTACILSSTVSDNWQINLVGASQNSYWIGLGFNLAGLNQGFLVQNGRWRFERCIFRDLSTTNEDLINLVQSGTELYEAILLECEANNSASDCYNGNGGGAVAVGGSFALLVNCRGTTPGASNQDQVLTTHGGLPFFVYGGVYQDAAANAWANDNVAVSPGYGYFASFLQGTREAGVKVNIYGSIVVCRSNSSQLIANQFISHNYLEITNAAAATSLITKAPANIEFNYLRGNSGRGVFSRAGDYLIRGNIFDGFNESVRIANFVAGSSTDPIEVSSNTFVNGNIAVNLDAPEIPCIIRDNAFRGNNNDLNATAGLTVTSDFNTLNTGDAEVTSGANDITAVADLDANFLPVAGGNCDRNGSDGGNRGAREVNIYD